MSLSDLASIGTLISGVAVLVSLVYLGLQTRQNTKHTRALIHQGRTDGIADWLNVLASDPTLLDIYLRGSAGDRTMTDAEAARFVVISTARLYSFEDQFYQHREGLLSEARYAGLLNAVKGSLRYPGSRACWALMRTTFDQGFQKFMDDALRDTPAEPATNFGAAFKSMSAAEG
jgi:hypothetical protein